MTVVDCSRSSAGLETVVVPHAGAATNEGQNLVGVAAIRREVFRPASRASTICEAAQIRTSASQIVAMPCSGTASTRMAIVAGAEVDRNDAPGFGEGEERIGHQILRIAWREIARQRAEQIKLFPFR